MRTWVRKTLSVGVLAAGALLFAPGAAHAGGSQDTAGNVGILNGTQVFAPVAVPLNVVGNAIGVAGEADSAGSGVNFVESGTHRGPGQRATQNSSGNFGIGNGTQAYLPVSVPVNVVGNSAAVLGLADATGAGVNHVESRKVEHGRGGDQNSSGNFGALNGSQVYAPVDVPINLCGNALGVLGLAQSQAACVNGDAGGRGHRRESGSQDTAGNVGVLNGTQVYAPISAPLNVAGNAIGVAGEADAAGAARNEKGHDDRFSQNSSGNAGLLNGTQLAAPISIPINVCGNSLAVLGLANSAAACGNNGDSDRGGDRGHGGHKGDWTHGDRGGNWGHAGHKGDWGHAGHKGDWGHGGHKGIGGDKGHGHGHGGNNGDRDDDHVGGDHGDNHGGDDAVGGNNGDKDDKYGKPGRKNVKEAGAVSNAGGLNVLDTLTK